MPVSNHPIPENRIGSNLIGSGVVRLLCAVCLLLVSVTTVWADQWPEFRGPQGNGYAIEADLPKTLDENAVQWQTPIHGRGWSSPVIWGNQIWLTTATEDGTKMSVICVDLTSGKVLHDIVLLENESPAFCHPTNSYASCSPAIEAGRVYVHFGSYLTACLDTRTAEVLWKRTDLQCDHYRGPASSPILHDGKLLVALDGVDQQYVVAFDKTTGETVWREDRNIDYGTDNVDWMKAYGTGEMIEVDGQAQFVAPSAAATVAYDPATGSPLWRVHYGGMNASARPLLDQDLLFLVNGMGQMVAVKTGGKGDVTDTHIAWSSKKSVSKKASPIVVDGLLYMNTDDGIISARRASDGEVLWRHRAGGSYAASPLYAGGLLYFFSSESDITTIKPAEEPTIVAETELGDGFMASPAVAGDALILRSKSQLYCLAKSSFPEPETKR